MLPFKFSKSNIFSRRNGCYSLCFNIFLQTDFSGLTSKQEENEAKNSAKEIIDKITANINDFKFRETLCYGWSC